MNRPEALRRNIVLYRLLLVFGANGLMVSVVYFFFTSIKGLDTAEALFLVGFGSLAKALSEVPTGVVADMISRRFSILMGYTILLGSSIGILVAADFWMLLACTMCGGIGGAFISGADDSLLYDSLKELGKKDTFKSVYNKSESIELVAFAITILIGGLLGGINLYIPQVVLIATFIISMGLSWLLIEPSMTKDGEEIEHQGYISHTKRSIQSIFSYSGFKSGLLGAFLSLSLIAAVFKSTKNILSPILDQYGFTISTVGLIVSAIILIKALGSFVASKVSKPGDETKEVVIGLSTCVVGLFLITVINAPLIQLIIFIGIIGMNNIILTNLKAIVNDTIVSNQRSTILSLVSLCTRTGEMLYLTSFGWIIDLYSIQSAVMFTAGWLLIALLVLQRYLYPRSVS